MRGAGCTFNDIIDRDIDARVADCFATLQPLVPSGFQPLLDFWWRNV